MKTALLALVLFVTTVLVGYSQPKNSSKFSDIKTKTVFTKETNIDSIAGFIMKHCKHYHDSYEYNFVAKIGKQYRNIDLLVETDHNLDSGKVQSILVVIPITKHPTKLVWYTIEKNQVITDVFAEEHFAISEKKLALTKLTYDEILKRCLKRS